MYQGLLVIDADAHKLENPLVMREYLEPEYLDRISLVIDSLGDQRAKITDFNSATGKNDLMRMFPKPQGLGKGGFRTLHPDTTMGAMFNRVRIEHMDQEGVDIQVIYGTLNLIFSSILDKDLAIALCRAYNDYIADDCRQYVDRLKPIGVLPLQDVDAAVAEMYRCINELGMISVAVAPNMHIISKAKNLFDLLWNAKHDPTKIDDASLYEHYDLRHRDPMEYFERGQIFASFELDDPSPAYLPVAMGKVGKRLACFSGDYGHWNGVLHDCVKNAASVAEYDREHLELLLSGNALALYGDRLRQSLPEAM